MFCAVLGNPDRIASLKFLGMEAQTRELTKTIDDAKEAIRQIRELGVVAAEALIDLRENSHAIIADAPGLDEYKEEDEFKAKVIEALKKMQLPPEQLAAVAQSDRNVVLSFYAYAAYRFGRSALPQSKWDEFDKAYNTLAAQQPPSPNQCQALFDSFHIDGARFADYCPSPIEKSQFLPDRDVTRVRAMSGLRLSRAYMQADDPAPQVGHRVASPGAVIGVSACTARRS